MSDANSIENVVNQEVVEPKQDAVQERINQITAEKYAAQEEAKRLQATVTDLVSKVAAMTQPTQIQAPELPEGVDPNVAKFFQSQMAAQTKMIQAQTEKLFWQVQHQQDQLAVNNKYANLPDEVRQDAARRLTGMKQRYGDAATMEDAIKFAHYEYLIKQSQNGRAAAFNGMGGPLPIQSGMPNVGGGVQSGQPTLVPPTQDPNWDRYDLATQNAKISEYEKKGGSLF